MSASSQMTSVLAERVDCDPAATELQQAPVRRRVHDLGRFSWRFNYALGFWLGGATLGVAGCVMGALRPYHHPVAMVLSMVWWTVYLGSFGASIGSLVGVLLEPAPAPPKRSWRDRATKDLLTGDTIGGSARRDDLVLKATPPPTGSRFSLSTSKSKF